MGGLRRPTFGPVNPQLHYHVDRRPLWYHQGAMTRPSPLAYLLGAAFAGLSLGLCDARIALLAGAPAPASPEEAATLALNLLLHLASGLALGVTLIPLAALARLLRAHLTPALHLLCRGRPHALKIAAATAAALAIALLPLSLALARGKHIDLSELDLRPPILLVAGAAVCAALLRGLGELPTPALIPGAALLPLSLVICLATYARAGDGQKLALLRLAGEAPLGQRLLRGAQRLFDRDRDGFPRALCAGGCDCDDRDPAVSPIAADVPGNGIDEDCSGADTPAAADGGAPATARDDAARLFAAPAAPRVPLFVPDHPPEKEPPPAPLCLRLPCPLAPGADLSPLAPPGPPAPQAPSPSSSVLAGKAGAPNILLITVDTLRADHLGAYGYPHRVSPRIDAWAAGAAVFEQARAAGPATRFSVPSMLTGKHFTEIHRSAAEWPRIEDDEVLLAERLRDHGYFTAAFHSIVYLQDRYGFGQGFAHRDHTFFRARAPMWEVPTADYVTDRVLRFADQQDLRGKAPFFIWAYYGDPHAPYIRQDVPPDQYQVRSLYDGEVAFSDLHIGRLLDGLGQRGLLDDTLVILTADHGEGLDRKEDHGSRHHSKNLYDELIRVPLIVRGPGVRARRVRAAVSLIDLVPTVLELLGKAPEPWLRGESLLPYLRGEDPPHRPVFAEKHRAEDDVQKAMVQWPYKVIMVLPYQQVRIYDLASDPKEQRDLSAVLPQPERERLVGALTYWAGHVLRPAPGNFRH